MIVVWSSDDKVNYIIKFNKKENKVIDDIINNDELLNKKFEIINIDERKYLFKQKDDIDIEDCVGYFKLVFAKDIMEKELKRR